MEIRINPAKTQASALGSRSNLKVVDQMLLPPIILESEVIPPFDGLNKECGSIVGPELVLE